MEHLKTEEVSWSARAKEKRWVPYWDRRIDYRSRGKETYRANASRREPNWDSDSVSAMVGRRGVLRTPPSEIRLRRMTEKRYACSSVQTMMGRLDSRRENEKEEPTESRLDIWKGNVSEQISDLKGLRTGDAHRRKDQAGDGIEIREQRQRPVRQQIGERRRSPSTRAHLWDISYRMLDLCLEYLLKMLDFCSQLDFR